MIAVARYLLAEHLRTRAFVAPVLVLVAVVVGLYAQPPNPVLATAGVVAAAAFPIQAWLALAFLNTTAPAQRHVLAATAGPRALVAGRLLGAELLALAVAVAIVAYPLLAGRLERAPHAGELALCLLAGLASTTAGTALAALFAQPLVRSRAVAVLGLAACALVTVPLDLPPAVPIARALDTRHAAAVPARLAGDLAWIGAFCVAVAVACALLWRRRE